MKLFRNIFTLGAAFSLVVQCGFAEEAEIVVSEEVTLSEDGDLANRYRDRPPPETPQGQCCPKPCAPKPCCPKPKPCPKPCAPVCQPKPCCPPKPCKEPCPCPPCFEQGYPTDCVCTPAAYSQAAAIDVRCGWDVFIDASFIYWIAEQDGMSLAASSEATISGAIAAPFPMNPFHAFVLQQKSKYKPGFKVGAGWLSRMDDWVLSAEYTWLHGATFTSSTPGHPAVGTHAIWNPMWVQYPVQTLAAGTVVTVPTAVTDKLNSKWKYKIDIVDAMMSRPFYSGKRLILEPYVGARAAWIRQSLSISYYGPIFDSATVAVSAFTTPWHSNTKSTSWGIGPRVGVNGNWHMGSGFRFIGNANGSILFTRYTKVRHNETRSNTVTQTNGTSYAWKKINCLRPNAGLDLGFGWGTYFGCWNYHFDFAATYEFNVFWNQNMMRNLVDLEHALTDAAPGNLYLHGLTAKFLFDF